MTRDEAIARVLAVDVPLAPRENELLEGVARRMSLMRAGAALHVDRQAALGLLTFDAPAAADPRIDEWLRPGGILPLSHEIVGVLVREIIRLRALSTSDRVSGE